MRARAILLLGFATTLWAIPARGQGEGPQRALRDVVRPFSSARDAHRRLAFERYGNAPALQSRQVQALAAQKIELVERDKATGYAATVLLVQKADDKLPARVKALSEHGPVVVAAISPAAFGQGEAQGKVLRELFSAKARRVIFWDDDKSPRAIDEALFSRASIAQNRVDHHGIAVSRPWVTIANSTRWKRVLEQVDHAVDARARVVLLVGEPGAGKQALMEQIIKRHQAKLVQDIPFTESALVPKGERELLGITPHDHGFVAAADSEWAQSNTQGSKGKYQPHLGVDEISRLGEAGQRHLAWLAGRARGSVILTLDAENADAKAAIDALGEPLKQLLRQRSTHVIHVPGLSQRREDIPHLATWFYSRRLLERWMSRTSQINNNDLAPLDAIGIEQTAATLLKELDYPHGVRSLRSVMEAAADRVRRPDREQPDINFESIASTVGDGVE